jgi:hypothetical protein
VQSLTIDEKAWADYLITRAGMLIFCSLLIIAAFNVHPLFMEKDTSGMLDAKISHLASYLEGVDSTSVQRSYYYGFDIPKNVEVGLSARYVTASTMPHMTRARALMTPVYPSNSLWNNRSGLMVAISNRCQGRTGIGGDLLLPSDWDLIRELLGEAEHELAVDAFVPDTDQPLIVEKVVLNLQGPEGIEKRGITIVYQ